jgi:hypothetical protein
MISRDQLTLHVVKEILTKIWPLKSIFRHYVKSNFVLAIDFYLLELPIEE